LSGPAGPERFLSVSPDKMLKNVRKKNMDKKLIFRFPFIIRIFIVDFPVLFRIAHNVERMACGAFFNKVVSGKAIPVMVLIKSENSRSFAKRAGAVKGGKDG